MEYPRERPSNAASDILIRTGDQAIALELTYLCQGVEYEVCGELFAPKPQGAQDVRRYDVLTDVWRMEQFLEARPTASAAVLARTNDPAYWRGPRGMSTCDAAFALREGRVVTGALNRAAHTGAGTKRSREAAIKLKGQYRMTWAHYSRIDGPFGEFRFLYLPVARP